MAFQTKFILTQMSIYVEHVGNTEYTSDLYGSTDAHTESPRAGSGPNPTRNLTRGSRVFKNPNRTGSFFGESEVTRCDIFLTRATRAQ